MNKHLFWYYQELIAWQCNTYMAHVCLLLRNIIVELKKYKMPASQRVKNAREMSLLPYICLDHAVVLYNEPKYLRGKFGFWVQCHNTNPRFVSMMLDTLRHNITVLFESDFSYVSAHYYGTIPKDLLSLSYRVFNSKLKCC